VKPSRAELSPNHRPQIDVWVALKTALDGHVGRVGCAGDLLSHLASYLEAAGLDVRSYRRDELGISVHRSQVIYAGPDDASYRASPTAVHRRHRAVSAVRDEHGRAIRTAHATANPTLRGDRHVTRSMHDLFAILMPLEHDSVRSVHLTEEVDA